MSAEPNGKPAQRRPQRKTAPPPKDKTLPHNLHVEATLLGALITNPKLLEELDTLEIDHFYLNQHKVVFEALRNLQTKDEVIDPFTVEAEIAKRGKTEAVGGLAFIGELVATGTATSSDTVIAYSKTLREHALIRRVMLKASEFTDKGYTWEYEADEFIGELIADLQQLAQGHSDAAENIPVITIEAALDELERLARTPIFETPFPDLNRALGFGGLLAGQVYYLCGGTGFGKTSFIATIVRALAVVEQRQAIIAFWEMFAAYYVARMSAGVLGVAANRILRGEVDRGAIARSLSHRIEMLDAPSLTTLKRLALRHVKAGRGAPLIVADYVQLLGDRILATMTRPDPRLANAQASGGLRELAKETGAAIIAVSAAGRSASKKLAADVRKMPARDLIDAARESGAIEFDGAGVIVLSVSDEKDGDENIATISVAKARFGETVHIDARYNGRTGEWREVGRVATIVKLKPTPDDGELRGAITSVLDTNGICSKSKICKLAKKPNGQGYNRTAVLSEVDAMVGSGLVMATANGFSLVRSEPVPEPTQTSLPEVP